MLCARQAGTETVEVDGPEVVVPVLEKLFLALEHEPLLARQRGLEHSGRRQGSGDHEASLLHSLALP